MNFQKSSKYKLSYILRSKWKAGVVSILVLIFAISCSDSPPITSKKSGPNEPDKKKVLFVNSYHQGYDWSDGITKGIIDTFGMTMKSNGDVDNSEGPVTLKVIYLDTKRNKAEEFKKEAALKAKGVIESWQPDLVITADDNAAKYLIVPYYKNSDLPFVFCAINLDASQYDFSTNNITGMVEVTMIKKMLKQLREYAKGDRIGLLGADTLTRRNSAAIYSSHYQLDVANRYAATFEDWKREFKNLQNEVDMLILTSPAGISGWNQKEAVQFVFNHTRIPSGCNIATAMPFALIGYTKVPEEQGEWAAQTALGIINGKSPRDIPVTQNRKAKIYLNMRLAKKLDIVFPIELIEQAFFVESETEN